MPINPGQGNTQGPAFPPHVKTSVYVYTTVASPVVGSVFFYNTNNSITMPAGTYKIFIDGYHKKFTVNSSGVVTAINICSWTSNKSYNPIYSTQRNNCGSGGVSNTITINDGGLYSFSGSGTYESFISQADADANANALAQADFNANVQTYINSVGTCTYTATGVSASYNTNFTRNNCGYNCYGSGPVDFGTTKSGYAATSTISYEDAYNTAYNQAYNDAVAYVNGGAGQNYANANGGCCCWVLEYYCTGSGCQRRSYERNTCTGENRNDSYVADNSCLCGQQCQGTYSTDWYCSGTAKVFVEKYYCNNSNTGNTSSEPCGCGSSGANWVYQYDTCLGGVNHAVYRDTAQCSPTYNKYKANELIQDGAYTNGGCNCIEADFSIRYIGPGVGTAYLNPCSGGATVLACDSGVTYYRSAHNVTYEGDSSYWNIGVL